MNKLRILHFTVMYSLLGYFVVTRPISDATKYSNFTLVSPSTPEDGLPIGIIRKGMQISNNNLHLKVADRNFADQELAVMLMKDGSIMIRPNKLIQPACGYDPESMEAIRDQTIPNCSSLLNTDSIPSDPGVTASDDFTPYWNDCTYYKFCYYPRYKTTFGQKNSLESSFLNAFFIFTDNQKGN